MTTSLARQLAALRTPASQENVRTEVYSGPFLIPDAGSDVCDPGKLRQSVTDSIQELAKLDPEFYRIGDVLLDEGVDVDNVQDVLEDVLLLLSPYNLLKSAQWLLQWLVSTFKVHYKLPDLFFWSVLHLYEYDIYRTSVEAITENPGGASKYPNWFRQFKACCFPTTKQNLFRHCASDRGFFKLLCDLMVRHGQHAAKYPSCKIQRSCTMFVMTMLGTLENCENVGEQQLLNLLQVILAGFKSDNEELLSTSHIMLSYLLPRAKLKKKPAAKILKVIEKSTNRRGQTEESLILVMLLVRTQPNVDLARLIDSIVHHQVVINSVVNRSVNDDSEDVKDLVDNVVYTLSLLVNSFLPPKGETLCDLTSDQSQLLDTLRDAVSSTSSLSPLTASHLASTACRLQTSLSRLEPGPVVDTSRRAKAAVAKIVSGLQARHPEEYRLAAVGTGDADIFFLGGDAGLEPTREEIGVKRALQNNELLNFLTSDFLVAQNNGVAKVVRKNRADIELVLGAKPDFLVAQLETDKLLRLLVNLVKVLDVEPDLQATAVKLLCSEGLSQIIQDPDVIELTLLPLLFFTEDPIVAQTLLKSHFAYRAPVLSLLTPLHQLLEKVSATAFHEAVVGKLKIVFPLEKIKTILDNKVTRADSVLITVVLLVIADQLNSASEQSTMVAELIQWVARNLEISGVDNKNIYEMISVAKKSRMVPRMFLVNVLDQLVDNTEDKMVCRNLYSILPILTELDENKVVEQIRKYLRRNIPDDMSYVMFLTKIAFTSSCLKTSFLGLVEIGQIVQDPKIANGILSKDENVILPYVLSLVLTNVSRIQKAAVSVLDNIVKNVKKSAFLLPLATFFIDHKSEIFSDISNIPILIKKEKFGTPVIHQLFLKTIRANDLLFPRLCPVFQTLSSDTDICSVCEYGSDLLQREDDLHDVSLWHLISTFTTAIVPRLDNDTCWKFFTDCVASTKTVDGNGVNMSVGQLMLEEMSRMSTMSAKPSVVSRVVSSCVGMSNSQLGPAARRLLSSSIELSPAIVGEQLKTIWGQDFATSSGRVGGRGRFSLIYGANEEDPKDGDRWVQTTFLLEVLERRGPSSSAWSALVQPIFVLLKKVALLDMEEASYRLSLLLSVLLRLLQAMTDDQLKQMQSGDLNPELLVHCIRSSPSPETRQTALLSLARVAVASPDVVLHNSVTIFTFMGSHLLKIDSHRTFQVACETIEVIVPAVRSACDSKQLLETNLSIVNTFVDASHDLPSHRYREVLYRLVNCLGEKEYLWISLLLVVKSASARRQKDKNSDRAVTHQRLVDLVTRYSARSGLEAILRILVNMRNDSPAVRKMFGVKERKPGATDPDDWDVLRLRSLLFVVHLLSSSSFVRHVQMTMEDEAVVQILNLLLEAAILSIESYNGLAAETPPKLQRSIVSQSEHVLETILRLLPTSLFLHLVSRLISSDLPSVRRRSLEVINNKLTSQDQWLNSEDLTSLVPALVKLSMTEEQPHNQQQALLTLRQLTRQISTSSSVLATAATSLSPTFISTITNPSVLGSAILCTTDVLVHLGPLAVPHVPGFSTYLIKKLDGLLDKLTAAPDGEDRDTVLVTSAVLMSLNKVVEHFSGFLNPSLPRLAYLSCRLSGLGNVGTRTAALLHCMASNVPPHSLLPVCRSQLDELWTDQKSIVALVGLLADNAKILEKPQLAAISKQYVDFFMFAFTYRDKNPGTDAEDLEEKIINAFLNVTLRLSLEDFRPIFYRIVNAQILSRSPGSLVTLFRVVRTVADRLKSLFSFAVELVLTQATSVLTLSPPPSCQVVSSVLACLSSCLTYNKMDSVNNRQYNQLVEAVVEVYRIETFPEDELKECIVRMAAATEDDTDWKHLNYQVLLCLRDSRHSVRLSVLSVLHEFVTARTDAYLAVLPDAVPFMSELLEDDQQIVETKCRDLIQHMEATFGQNIENYFI